MGGRPGVTLCYRGSGSAERYITPIIMYNIYYNWHCYVAYVYLYIFRYTCIIINMYT